uniref:Putative plant transposon protein domain-containing protein n=1 Tax=Solanum tuberosum TaxID=4113 RepID=M1DZX6_SOLTU
MGAEGNCRTWGPLNSIMVRGTSVDISEATINMMLHGSEYTASASVGLFKGKHHTVTSETEMEVQSSRERVLRWIARQIASEGENAAWVTETPVHITKASLSFPAKVWRAIVRAQLRHTDNDDTLSPSLASLVTCLMASYPVKVGKIIATEMWDRALNERAGLLFPCLIGKLSRQADILPNRLVDKWGKAFRLTKVSKIKDIANHLFGVKSGAMGSLVVVPHVTIDIPHADKGPKQGESSQPSIEAPLPPASASQAPGNFVTIPTLFLEKLVADQRQTKTVVDQIIRRMPQLIERNMLVVEKKIKDKMQKELVVLKDRMDVLEVHVQEQLQVASDPLITQSLDDFYGELPKRKSGKRKKKAGESDDELSADLLADLSKEDRRKQEKKKHLPNNSEMQC